MSEVEFGTPDYPVEGRLISAFYRAYNNNYPDLFLCIRDTSGKKIFLDKIRSDIRPFCYVGEKDMDLVKRGLNTMAVKHYFDEKPYDVGVGEGTAFKLYLWEPWRVGSIKRYFRASFDIELFEADIPYIRRFRIEKGIKAGVRIENGIITAYDGVLPKARNLYIDIEVDDSMGFPEEAGEFYILCIGWADDDGNEGCFTWNYGEEYTEADMLQDFYNFALQYDNLVVWNKDFEGEHLPKRCAKLGLSTEWRAWRLVDLAEFYRMYNQYNHLEKLPVGYLETVKKFRGKLDSMGIRIRDERLRRLPSYYDAWKNDPEDMVNVNISHAYALYVMEKAMEVISLYSSVADETGMFVDFTTMNSHVVDTLALRMLKDSRKRWVIPSNTGLRGKGFKGAVVFPAKRGVHEFVFLFDFTSLYNRIIQSYYLDPIAYSKWGGTFTVDGVGEYIKFAKIFGEMYGIKVDMGEGDVRRLPIFPAILWTLEQRRNELKAKRKTYPHGTPEYELYDSLQKAAKVVLLACYGVLGMTSSRWAVSKEIPREYIVQEEIDYRVVGEAREKFVGMVTHIAREALEDTKEFFDEQDDVDVIYGDTDSVFTQPVGLLDMSKKYGDLTEDDLVKLLKFGVDYGDKLEKFYESRFESGIEMKLEKIFDRGVFGKVKKQYYCRTIWDEDGGWQMDGDKLSWYEYTKGLPLVRTDRCAFLKTYQRKTLQTMLDNPEDIAPMWDVAVRKMYNNEVDHMFILRIGVKKPLSDYKSQTPQVRAALKNVERGLKHRPGEKVAFIITDVKKGGKSVVEPIDETLDPIEAVAKLPPLTKKALDYYWKKRIWKNIQPFLDLVLTEEQITVIELNKEKKTSLKQFFS